MTIVIFLIVLAVLIFVHELGHFIAARIFGIRVESFKLGFGPSLFSWKIGDTDYGINFIPFGGYVKLYGENAEYESTGAHMNVKGPSSDAPKRIHEKHSGSFADASGWKQAIILGSGVFCNFLFAWFLYTCVFAHGVTVSTSGFEKYSANFTDPRVIITYVLPDSPAGKAGLKEGDTIHYVESTAMNAERARMATSTDDLKYPQTIAQIQDVVNHAGGKPLAFEYIRNGTDYLLAIKPVPGLVDGKFAIGISMDNVADLQLPVLTSLKEAFFYTLTLIRETAIGLYTFIANIFVGHPNFSDVAGPVGIAGIVGNAASLGFVYLLMVTAIISVNLGVVNLIPFPALDGGRILFVAIEAISRKRIPAKVANVVNTIGFILLMILMVAVTWRDIAKMF